MKIPPPRFRLLCLLAFLSALAPCSVHAQLDAGELAGLQMENFPGINPGGQEPWDSEPYPLASTDLTGSELAPHLATLTLQAGPGWTPHTQSGFYRFGGQTFPTSATISDAYVQFTLTPEAGYGITLADTDSLQVYSRIYASDSAATFVATSADNFTTLFPATNPIADTTLRSYDITGITEHLGSLTIRLYVYDSDGSLAFAVRQGGSLGALAGSFDVLVRGGVAPIIAFDAPTILGATAGGETSLDLTWTDPNSGEDGYEIQFSDDGGATWASLITLPENTTTHTHSGLQPSTAYSYRLRATGAEGVSPFSATVTGSTDGPPPAAASNLGGTAPQGVLVNLNWQDNSGNETAFRIERSTEGGPFVAIDTLPLDSTAFLDRSAVPGTAYQYRVVALNASGEASPSNTVSLTTPATSHLNFLVFGNSFSHFYDHLPDLAANTGDSLNQVILRTDSDIVLRAILDIEAGLIEPIDQAEAEAMNPGERRNFGWTSLETDYNTVVDVKAVLDSREWDVASFQQGSPRANNAAQMFSLFDETHNYFVVEGREPSAEVLHYATTQYRNDALLYRNPHNSNVQRSEVLRGDLPYTADLHAFDALTLAIGNSRTYGIPVTPGGAALQNLRYDPRWGVPLPDLNYDYFDPDEPDIVFVPENRKLFASMRRQDSPRGDGGALYWGIDSHPASLLNYLTACVWYQRLFHKDVRLNTYVPAGFDPDTCVIIRDVAYRTAKGELPPLRLAHQADRDAYGNLLWDEAQTLLASTDPGENEAGLRNLVHLYAYFPEHARAADAGLPLEANGLLEEADDLAETEAAERPVRERVYQEIWDSASPGGDGQSFYTPDVDPAGSGAPAAIRQALGLAQFTPISQPFDFSIDPAAPQTVVVIEHTGSVIHGGQWDLDLMASSSLAQWVPLAPDGSSYLKEVFDPDPDGTGLREAIRHTHTLPAETDRQFHRLRVEKR